jgi:hypothetical protein
MRAAKYVVPPWSGCSFFMSKRCAPPIAADQEKRGDQNRQRAARPLLGDIEACPRPRLPYRPQQNQNKDHAKEAKHPSFIAILPEMAISR